MRKVLFSLGRILALLCSPFEGVVQKSIGYIRSGYQCRGIGSIGRYVFFYPGAQLKGQKYMFWGENISIGRRTLIMTSKRYETMNPRLVLGNNINIGSDCFITCSNSISIGNNVLMGAKITITDNSHGRIILEELCSHPSDRPVISKGPIVIGNCVWIADKVTILPGVTIGDGAIIGANSVVTKDVPSNCVAAGNPAKVIRLITQ